MATTTHEREKTTIPSRSGPAAESSGVGRILIIVVAVVMALLGLGYGAVKLIDVGDAAAVKYMTHTVQRGNLDVTITEDGNVESASNLEIKCRVAGGSSILWIVEDGKEVEEGEKLVELDQSQLEEDISQQTITYEKARSASIQAEKDHAVAMISVQEYLEGTFKKEQQDADAQITIAEENLRSAKNALAHSERMFRRGYISSLELESQQFAVQRAQLELDSANTSKEVLEKFSKVKMLEDLKSQVETAKARMESEKAALDLESARLQRLKDQLSYCVITAPKAGMVVYANESSGRFGSQQGPQIEEGAAVRERQDILKLPDLSEMQVKVTVHETKVDSLRRGMRAQIKIQNQTYQGTVTSVANQPEPTSFFSASVKEYATIVKIDGESNGLRPGMTAEVEILVAHLKDALTLPVATIVEQRNKFFCWVLVDGVPQRRQLVLGMSDDEFVEVKDGVKEGDQVLLNPRAFVADARGGDAPEEDLSVDEKFGAGASEAAPDAPSESDRGGPREGRDADRSTGGGPPAGGGEGGGWRGGRGGAGGGGGGRGNLMQFDQDGDGKVSKDEAPERMQGFFDRLDGDGDGFIDQTEIDAMRSRGGGGRGGPGGGGGAGGGRGGSGGERGL